MDIEELKSWLQKEVEFTGQIPSDDQLKSLCAGSMRDVWSHLINHCKSQEKTKIIRANLAISSRKQNSMKSSFSVTSSQLSNVQDGGERDELLAERSLLTSQLHTTLANIQRLKKDIKDAEDYKLTTLKTQSETEEQIVKLRKSHTLLNLYRKQVDMVLAKLNSLTEKIDKHCQELKHKRNLSKKSESVGDARMESSSEKTMNQVVDKVMTHMKQVLFNSSSVSRASLRQELLTRVSGMSGTCVQLALINNAQNQIDRIGHQLDNFDLRHEAESLMAESSEAGGGGQSGALVSFVRDEVDTLTKHYLCSHQELLAARKRLASMEEELDNLFKENIDNILDMNQMKASIKKSFEVGVEDEKIRQLEIFEARLRELEVTEENQEQVISWSRNAETNIQEMVNLISMLIESRSSSYKKLQARKAVTDDLVKSVPEAHSSLVACIQKARSEPDDMMNTFLQLPVSRYTSTVVEDTSGYSLVPTPDLNIYRLSKSEQYPGKKQIKDDQEALTNSNKSLPSLSYKVYRLLSEIDELEKEKQKSEEGGAVNDLLESVKKLPRILNGSRLQQVKDFLPLMQKTDDKCSAGVELCEKVRQALADYDAQYTQVVVGRDEELQVEARNLAQWQEALRVAILHT